MKESEGFFAVHVNGIDLHYLVTGEGRPVVLIHGNGQSHELFETEIRQLVHAGYRVYAPDSRGHGANNPVNEYHYADMAEDIFLFIREMRMIKPAFYGHSDGGIIGLLLEILHPGTLGIMAVSGTNLSPDGLQPGFIKAVTAENERKADPLNTLMLTEPHIDPAALKTIRIPVLVTVGEQDLVLASETQCIVDNLPDSTLKIIEGADHGSYIENSEVMGNLLLDFLSQKWTGKSKD